MYILLGFTSRNLPKNRNNEVQNKLTLSKMPGLSSPRLNLVETKVKISKFPNILVSDFILELQTPVGLQTRVTSLDYNPLHKLYQCIKSGIVNRCISLSRKKRTRIVYPALILRHCVGFASKPAWFAFHTWLTAWPFIIINCINICAVLSASKAIDSIYKTASSI